MLPCRSHPAQVLSRHTAAALLCVVALLGLLLGGCAHTTHTPAPVAATATSEQPAATSADEPEAPARELNAKVFATIQYEATDFYYNSPPSFPPLYKEQKTIFSGQSVLLAIVAKGFALSNENEVNITYTIEVVEPGGNSYKGPADIPLFKGKVRSADMALFPRNTPMLYFREGEPTGLYTILLSIRDNNSGQEQQLETQIRVRSYRPPALPEGFNPIEWMENYYRHPTPELALPALTLLGSLSPRTWPPHLQNDYTNAQSRMIGFYDRLLADNPWLLAHFAEAYTRGIYLEDDHPQNLRPQIEQILRTHFRRFAQRPQSVPLRLWNQCRSPQFIPTAEGSPTVGDSDGRERLLGQFFASGSFRPVYTLARASTLHTGLDEDARRINSTLRRIARSGQQAILPPGALNSLDRNSQALVYTLWALQEHFPNHPQLEAYLQNILQKGVNDTFDERSLELLASVKSADTLQATGIPPINTTPDLSYLMLQENHDLLRESYDHHPDLRSEDVDLRTEQLIRLDELAEASADTLLRWQQQMLRPHRITQLSADSSTTLPLPESLR